MSRFHTPFAGFEPPPHLAEAYRRKLLQQQQQLPVRAVQPPSAAAPPAPSTNEPPPPSSPEISATANVPARRFMQSRAGFGPLPQAAAEAAVQRLPYTAPRGDAKPPMFPESPQGPSDVGQAWDAMNRLATESPPLRDLRGQPHAPPAALVKIDPGFSPPMRLRENVDPGFTPDPRSLGWESVDPGFIVDDELPGRMAGLPPPSLSPHIDLRERPRSLAPEEHQSLPPPGPPPQGTKLHDLLGQDPDNALKFFNLTKWPPPSHLLHVQRTPGNEHLRGNRPRLVLKWVKEIAAARPELLTHNGAVRYLLNTLKDTLRTDYTRRGEPVPEDAQLEQETFQLIDHTLAEAGQTQAPGQEKGPVNSYAEPARERLAVQERTSATPQSGDPDAWNEPPSVLQPSEFSPQTVSENQPIAALLGRDRDFLDRWRRERNRVPTDDFMKVVRKPGFEHLAGNLDGVALEWLRQQWAENPDAFSLPTRQHDLWQTLKDGIRTVLDQQGKPAGTDRELEENAHRFLEEARATSAQIAQEDHAQGAGVSTRHSAQIYRQFLPRPDSPALRDDTLSTPPRTSTFVETVPHSSAAEVMRAGLKEGLTPEAMAEKLLAWRDEVRRAAEARYGDTQSDHYFGGNQHLDEATAEMLRRLREAAVVRWRQQSFRSEAEYQAFLKAYQQAPADAALAGPYQKQARELRALENDPRWTLPRPSSWHSVAEPGGNEIGRFQVWPHPDGSAEIRLNYGQSGEGTDGQARLKLPAVTDADVEKAVQKAQEELKRAQESLVSSRATAEAPVSFSGDMGLGQASGSASSVALDEARIRELQQRLALLMSPNGKMSLMSERVVEAIKKSPLKDKFGRKDLWEDYVRGLAGFYVGMRVGWNDLTGDKEEYEEWRQHLENLSRYLPGSTGSRFRGGWEEFLSDVVESAGAATPQMLMTVATGGYSAATQGAARSLLLGRAVTGLQVGSTTLGSYGNNVANADRIAKDLRELAKGIEYEFPEEAAKIRAEADSIEKYRRWTAAGRAVVDAAVDRILPEEKLPLNPGPGGFVRRQANAQTRNLVENGLGNGAGQVYDNIAYGTPIDPKQGAYDTATGTVANAPMTGVGAWRGRADNSDLPSGNAQEANGPPKNANGSQPLQSRRGNRDLFLEEEGPASPPKPANEYDAAEILTQLDQDIRDFRDAIQGLGGRAGDGGFVTSNPAAPQASPNGAPSISLGPDGLPLIHFDEKKWAKTLLEENRHDSTAAKEHGKAQLAEEIWHAAHLLVLRNDWIKDGQKLDGKGASFEKWLSAKSKSILDEVNTSANRASPAEKKIIQDALVGTWQLYFGRTEGDINLSFEQVQRRLSEHPGKDGFVAHSAFLAEFTRQLHQAGTAAYTTEVAGLVQKLKAWVDKAVNALYEAYGRTKDGALGESLKKLMDRTEALRNGMPGAEADMRRNEAFAGNRHYQPHDQKHGLTARWEGGTLISRRPSDPSGERPERNFGQDALNQSFEVPNSNNERVGILPSGEIVVFKRDRDRMVGGQKVGGIYHGYVLELVDPNKQAIDTYLRVLKSKGFNVKILNSTQNPKLKNFSVTRDPKVWGPP